MLHRDERLSKEAKYQQEWKQDNPEKVQKWKQDNPGRYWADGEEKPDAVHQGPLFGQRRGDVLYVDDASETFTTPPTNMGKIQDTKFARNNQGASNAQKEESDTDQGNATDPMREQCRFYWAGRQNSQTKPEYAEWAIAVRQCEDAMGSVTKPAKVEQVNSCNCMWASLKCSLCNSVLTTVCCLEVNQALGQARAAL